MPSDVASRTPAMVAELGATSPSDGLPHSDVGDTQVRALCHAAHLGGSADRGGDGDPAGAGHGHGGGFGRVSARVTSSGCVGVWFARVGAVCVFAACVVCEGRG